MFNRPEFNLTRSKDYFELTRTYDTGTAYLEALAKIGCTLQPIVQDLVVSAIQEEKNKKKEMPLEKVSLIFINVSRSKRTFGSPVLLRKNVLAYAEYNHLLLCPAWVPFELALLKSNKSVHGKFLYPVMNGIHHPEEKDPKGVTFSFIVNLSSPAERIDMDPHQKGEDGILDEIPYETRLFIFASSVIIAGTPLKKEFAMSA